MNVLLASISTRISPWGLFPAYDTQTPIQQEDEKGTVIMIGVNDSS